jgi:hypothetical protein
MENPRDKLFSDLVRDIIYGEEDLMIAEQNGRKLDEWMQDRIDGVRRSYEALPRPIHQPRFRLAGRHADWPIKRLLVAT